MSDQALTERKVDRDMADTIPVRGQGLTPGNAGQLMEMAKMMAASGSAVPKHLRGQPGACLGILDDAFRLGVSPYALARKSYFVNDQLAYEAQVPMALINTSPVLKHRPELKFEGADGDRRCIVTGHFRDGQTREYRSPRFADIHPKNSPLWKSDPDQQHSYYSLRAFARRWCPEVLMGIVDVDELRDQAMTDITPVAAPEPARAIPRSLDDFAATEPQVAAVPDSDDGSSAPPSTGSPQGAAATPHHEPDTGEVDEGEEKEAVDMKSMAISAGLKLATATSVPLDRRIASLESELHDVFGEDVPGAFLDKVATTCIQVARNEIKADRARVFLEQIR